MTPHTLPPTDADGELREKIKQIKLPSVQVYSVHPDMRVKDLVDTSLEEQIVALIQSENDKAALAARLDERNMMSKAFYEADRDEIPMEQIYAQHLDRIAQLSHPAPELKSDKE